MIPLLLLATVGIVVLWIYAEFRLGPKARITLGGLTLASVLCCFYLAAKITDAFRRAYYEDAIRHLVAAEDRPKQKAYEAMLTEYSAASKRDGVYTFYGATTLRQEAMKLEAASKAKQAGP